MAVTVRQGGALIGLGTFFIYARQGMRTLAILGSGISDYLDILTGPESDGELVASEILRHLDRRASTWDVCDLQELRECSPLLAAARRDNAPSAKTQQAVCPVLPLPRSVSEYYGQLGYKFRKRLRRTGRLLEREGDLRYEAAEEGNAPEFLDDLFRLHGQRWQGHDLPGVLADQDVRSFHRQAVPALMKRGLLRFYRLLLDGITAAVLYGFMCKGRFYLYLSGMSPRFERLSPGMAIINHAIEQAITAGAYECDFLRGTESYKYRWNVRDHYNYRLLLSRSAA